MKIKKVRVGRIYKYVPVLLDRMHPPVNIEPGDIVKVKNIYGCPKANTMGHAYVFHGDGSFAGLVHVNSLLTKEECNGIG